jgi:3-oxoacyl-[acyl-carrier-protein] synthase II
MVLSREQEQTMSRKVVVTGVGMLTPIGHTPDATFEALCAGQSGGRRVAALESATFGDKPLDVVIGATIEDLDPSDYVDRKEAKRMDPFILYAQICAVQAWRQSGLPEKLDDAEGERGATLIGVGLAGVEHIFNAWDTMKDRGPRRISPLFIPSVIGNMAPGYIGMRFNLRGPNWTPGAGNASGAVAVGEGLFHIRDGRSDLVLTGGAESTVTPMIICAYNNMGGLSTRRQDDAAAASRPFDKDRDGAVIGEGAAVLILETEERAKARGITPLCEVAGYGVAKDPGVPNFPKGPAVAKAVKRALEDAGISADEVDWVCAHGSGHVESDRNEMRGLAEVFGDRASEVMVSSIKGSTGDLLGASGAVEAGIAAMAVARGKVPPTVNLHDLDPECGAFHFVKDGCADKPIRAAVSVNIAVGGLHTALVFTPYAG